MGTKIIAKRCICKGFVKNRNPLIMRKFPLTCAVIIRCYDYTYGHLVRLRFGNSLLNSPTAEDLGTFNDALPTQCEGLQVLRVNGNIR